MHMSAMPTRFCTTGIRIPPGSRARSMIPSRAISSSTCASSTRKTRASCWTSPSQYVVCPPVRAMSRVGWASWGLTTPCPAGKHHPHHADVAGSVSAGNQVHVAPDVLLPPGLRRGHLQSLPAYVLTRTRATGCLSCTASNAATTTCTLWAHSMLPHPWLHAGNVPRRRTRHHV
jgi:hypothetical protein